MSLEEGVRIAIIIPAYNEEKTIAAVVREYKKALPEAKIVVGDNNSRDKTARLAKEAGADVIPCERQGKGNAVRHLMESVDADIYVMTDADLTYSASNIRDLVEEVRTGRADMVIGSRRKVTRGAFSISHKIGNKILTGILNRIFKVSLKDILSGYRVMSRKLIDHLILLAEGFEIEVELTIRTLEEHFKIKEIPIDYRHRPEGSDSKLSTWGDGFLILYTIITLFRDYNPMMFFVILSLIFFFIGMVSGLYIFILYLNTGLMRHIGLAIVTALCIMLSAIIFLLGLLLDSFNNNWRMMRESLRRGNGKGDKI